MTLPQDDEAASGVRPNLDRLWLKWQEIVGATTLNGFKSTLAGDTGWLSPPVNVLPPLEGTSG